jgi:hypothetical protein
MNAGMMPRRPIDRPIIIIGCNRSGTTLLFRNLAEHPFTWSLYDEGQEVYYRHYPIHPQLGDRLTEPPTPHVAQAITEELYARAHNKEVFKDRGVLRLLPRKLLQQPVSRLYKHAPIRLLEKTPANSLRVPFLNALFPDARFLFIVRRAEDVISSLMEGWENWSGTRGQPWKYGKWHYLVPPGWQKWTGRPLAEICAFQWIEANRTAWQDLKEWCSGRYLMVRHEDALSQPRAAYSEILSFCELPPSRHLQRMLAAQEQRVFTQGGSEPERDKWRRLHGEDIEGVRPMFRELMAELYPTD